jgi:hypothetical protein
VQAGKSAGQDIPSTNSPPPTPLKHTYDKKIILKKAGGPIKAPPVIFGYYFFPGKSHSRPPEDVLDRIEPPPSQIKGGY